MAEKVKKENIFQKIGKFFKSTKSEFKKVTWPTKKQLLNNTAIVITALVLIGLVIFGLDSLFSSLSKLILG